jgi:hypothetical protein
MRTKTQAERNARARADQARERAVDYLVARLDDPPRPDHWVVVYSSSFTHRVIMRGDNLIAAKWHVEQFGPDRYLARARDIDTFVERIGYKVNRRVSDTARSEYASHVRRC